MLSTPVGNPEDLAGYRQAVAAIEQVGGVLLTPEAARLLALVALHMSGPAVRAELLADIADDLVELASQVAEPDGAFALTQAAYSLDLAGYQIRAALEGST